MKKHYVFMMITAIMFMIITNLFAEKKIIKKDSFNKELKSKNKFLTWIEKGKDLSLNS